jgi:Protein of unknown function (DUF2283)
LQIRISDKPIVREVSQDWHTNISYAEAGTIVEIMLFDAKKEGLLPLEFGTGYLRAKPSTPPSPLLPKALPALR